jgi:hypothetical protein
MTQRRELSELLIDVADGALATAREGIRMTSLQLSLPVEVALEQRNGALAIVAELPRFIYRTSFDRPSSRLIALWHEGDAP